MLVAGVRWLPCVVCCSLCVAVRCLLLGLSVLCCSCGVCGVLFLDGYSLFTVCCVCWLVLVVWLFFVGCCWWVRVVCCLLCLVC